MLLAALLVATIPTSASAGSLSSDLAFCTHQFKGRMDVCVAIEDDNAAVGCATAAGDYLLSCQLDAFQRHEMADYIDL